MRIRARDRERERTQQRTPPPPPSSSTSVGLRTSSTLGTTEIITISPDAHKIRFTLDSNEVTSELPVLTQGPSASKLVSTFLVPDDVFSQATHTLMKDLHKNFLPTQKPKKRQRGRFILAATSNG